MQEQKHEVRARKAKLAITYITCGTLMVVWSLVWLVYLTLPRDVSGYVYIASGVILSGIAVVVIGFSVGNIGKDANADDPEMHPGDRPDHANRKANPSLITGNGPAHPAAGERETHRTGT